MDLDENSDIAGGSLSISSMNASHSTGQRTSCDSCKRSKLKCKKEAGENKCTRCIARNTECSVTLVSRKKREKKTHYLSAIEDRMKRMESAMNASGISIDDTAEASIPSVTAQSALEDKLSIFMINDDGVSGFVGPSSGFSLFSPQGLRWISEKTGSKAFEDHIRGVAQTCDKSVFPNTFMPNQREIEPLPDITTAKQYLETYFSTFNCAFPLYDQESVMSRFSKDYYNVSRERDPAWYASLNIIFLIGRGVARKDNGRDITCERYFTNASSVFTELLFNAPSLLAVQAMIGMAFVMQAGEDPHPAYVLIGSASRLAQAIGLHRRLDGYGLSPRESEQRRNVFWIALGLEKGISIRSGRPSVFSDDDIGVELPAKNPNVNKDLDKEHSVLDSFRNVATLALLESRIYSRLYSARSRTKTELERLKWVGALDTELAQWRDELPVMIRPERPIRCHSKHLMHVIMMHFAYYNCVVAIHRGSVHHGSWINTKKPDTVRDAKNLGLNPRVFESGAICLKAARQVIGLLSHYDTGNTPSSQDGRAYQLVPNSSSSFSSVLSPEPAITSADQFLGGCRLQIKDDKRPEEEANTQRPSITTLPSMCNYYPLAASLTLFANILQNPAAPSALPDLALMSRVTSILRTNFSAASNPRSGVHFEIFKQILSVAAKFVAKARGEDPEKYKDLAALEVPNAAHIMGCNQAWGGSRGGAGLLPLERGVSTSTSTSHSGNENDEDHADHTTNSGTTPGSGSQDHDGYRLKKSTMQIMAPADTPSPAPPPYIPAMELQTREGFRTIPKTSGRTPGQNRMAATSSEAVHAGGDFSRSGTESPSTQNTHPPAPVGLLNAVGGGTGCYLHSGSGTRSGPQFCDGNHLNGVPLQNPINSNTAEMSRVQSMQDLRLNQQTSGPILDSNGAPYISTTLPQISASQQPMDNAFDFNQYNWQPQTSGQPGNTGFAAEGEMNFEDFTGQEMGGQNGEDGDFLPMVFQWDLGDIWGSGNGFEGMGSGGMGF